MLELKITGANAQELYVNGVNTLLLLTRGGQEMFKPAPPVDAPAAAGDDGNKPDVIEAVAEDNPKAIDVVSPKRRGRQPKPPVTIEATAELGPETTDEDPLGLSDVKPEALEEIRELTLDDMRDRVKAIIKAHTEDRGFSMADGVTYVRKLFAPFGVKLAAELKPAQFAEFWSVSQTYLDGSAK